MEKTSTEIPTNAALTSFSIVVVIIFVGLSKKPKGRLAIYQLVSNGRVYIGTVFISTRMPWSVFPEALKTRPAGCGAMFTTKHP